MGKGRRSSTELPVPREVLTELGLTDEQVDDAIARRPRWVSPPPSRFVDGAWVDVDAIARVQKAFAALRHTKTRKWAGRPLVLEPWSLVWIYAPVFGWKHPLDHADEDLAGTRIVRTLWDEEPRKNGKSTRASATGLILLAADGEPGGEVYAAAGSREQAGIVFNEAKKMAAAAPQLARRTRRLAGVIRHPSSGSFFRSVSKLAELAHGLNVHGAIIDEVHVHKTRELIDAIESGTGSRDQPLIVYITTADADRAGTIYEEKHNHALAVAQGTIVDPTTWVAIWCADANDDPFVEPTWAKANPNYGISVTKAYLAKEAAKAQSTPSYLPTFLRLHLNIRTKDTAGWVNLDHWDAPEAAGLLDEPGMAGLRAHGGLDLSATTDFTAWALLFPGDQFDDGRWRTLVRLWVPETAVAKRPTISRMIERWASQGWVTITDGDVVDYNAVEDQIDKDLTRFDVVESGHDRWNAPPFLQDLVEGGMTTWPVPQTFNGLSAATKDLERLLGARLLVHGGNPALRWMATNAVSQTDHNKNVRLSKKSSKESIDGLAALVNAFATVVRAREADTQERLEGDLMA